MLIAPRIVSAALALAAIVSLPFTQSAHAFTYPDAVPEPASPAYQVYGNIFATPGNPGDPNAKVRVFFRVTNYGGESTGNILVIPMCNYDNNYKLKSYAAKPASFIPALTSGKSDLVWFDWPRHQNYEGMPVSASLTIRGVNELDAQLENNKSTVDISYDGN